MYAIDARSDMQLYTSDGAGHLTGGQHVWPAGGLWRGFRDIAVADFSSDGWVDVAGIDAYGDLRLYTGSSSGQLSGGALMWPGRGLWGGFRQIAADARTVPCAGARTVYLPLGDSITEGYKSRSGNGYRAVLADKLSTVAPMGCGWSYAGTQASGSRYYPHEGHSGETINQIASHLPASLNAMAPAGLPVSVVLLGAGTNDDGQNRTADRMLSDMSALLDRIHAGRPSTKVLVAQITITTRNSPAQQQAERDFNAGLPALAAGKGGWVRVVDMSDVHLSADRIHPDDAGYADMAGRWHTALTANGWLP
jgi:lysophospholipase L1-like esterase